MPSMSALTVGSHYLTQQAVPVGKCEHQCSSFRAKTKEDEGALPRPPLGTPAPRGCDISALFSISTQMPRFLLGLA